MPFRQDLIDSKELEASVVRNDSPSIAYVSKNFVIVLLASKPAARRLVVESVGVAPQVSDRMLEVDISARLPEIAG